MKQRFHISLLTGVLLNLLLMWACHDLKPVRHPPEAVGGLLDLRDWNLDRDGPVALSGEYEFYWRQHLTPEDFSKPRPPRKTGLIRVPGYWNSYKMAGKKLPGDGYATYRLTVLLDKPAPTLALKYLEMSTAFDIYVDERKIVSVGRTGRNPRVTTPRFRPDVVTFESSGNIIRIMFHVSNFDHRRGGAWEVVKLGREQDIRKLFENSLSIDLFLFGCIFMMGLYHLGLFTLRAKDRSPLYFCIICLLIAMRLLTTGERYLIHLIPDIDWELMIRLEYLSFYLAIPVFAQFMQSLFSDFSKWFLYVVIVIGAILSGIVVLTPAKIYSHTLPLYEILTVIVFLYGLYVIVVAMFRKKAEAYVFFIGFLVLSFSVINDILHVERIIQTQFIAPFGLFIFILFQAFFLSFRFARALNVVEAQRLELRDTLESYKKEIIDRVHAEASVKIAQERLLTVLDSIDADIYVVDMETYAIIFMNKHMRDHLGENLIGKTCWQVLGCEPRPCRRCTPDQLLDKDGSPKGVYVWEERHPHTGKWHMKHSRAIRWAEDRFVLLHVATDISERKAAEIALRESEEKYRTILQSIEEGYYEVDLAGNMTFYNESMCKISGYDADELMGMNNRQYMSPETAKEFYRTFNQVYRTGVPATTVDWETIRKDGQVNVLEISVSLIKDPEGRPTGFRGIARDITARKKAEELSRLHQHQLMQASKMVAIGTLVSGVAHEINNPNNFIMLNSKIVEEAWKSALPILEDYYRDNGQFIIGGMNYTEMRDSLPALFTGISDGTRRIKQIVDDLKTYVREDTADLTQEIDINAVIESAVSLLAYMIKNATHAFKIEYGENLPLLRGNFQRLEQVIINLIQNACQALPGAAKGISVSVNHDSAAAAVIVTIADEGVGMPSETISAIMEPFFTTKSDTGGVGLGLSISARIVEEHGGWMRFTSQQGCGTVAEIILPVPSRDQTA
ncbi:MAG: PAS domain S-box protein [Desulfobacterales bacterium]|nr:PAS domain S-box protein [Desulfobacterales bacterium]